MTEEKSTEQKAWNVLKLLGFDSRRFDPQSLSATVELSSFIRDIQQSLELLFDRYCRYRPEVNEAIMQERLRNRMTDRIFERYSHEEKPSEERTSASREDRRVKIDVGAFLGEQKIREDAQSAALNLDHQYAAAKATKEAERIDAQVEQRIREIVRTELAKLIITFTQE